MRSFRQHRAFVQAGDLDAEFAHEGHVVLDDHDRLVLLISLSSSAGLLRLDVGHAGDRFVDQQQLRVLRQQHADLEPLLLAVAQARRPAVARVGQADGLQDAVDPLGSSPAHAPEQRAHDAVIDVERQQRGCPRRSGFRTPSASGTCGRCRARRCAVSSSWVRSVSPSKRTSPVVRPGLAGDDVHHRRLAGAVRADDGAHLAGLERQRQVVEAWKPSKETDTPSR